MASLAGILQSVFSTIFRVLIYIYLRIIPARPGVFIVPSVFLAYLVSWTVHFPNVRASVIVKEEETAAIKPSANGEKDATIVAASNVVTIAVVPTSPSTSISTVLFSLPNTQQRTKILGLVVNVALLAMATDFLARPQLTTNDDLTFTRVGAVYNDAAKIIVRYPNLQDGVRIVYKQAGGAVSTSDQTGWMDGPLVQLSVEKDWVGAAKLGSLWAGTDYQYRLAAANATLLPYPASAISFRTFPDSRIPGTRFKFVASSCILPNFPYSPFKPPNRIKGFELLSRHLFATAPAGPSPAPSTVATSSSPTGEQEAPSPVVPQAPSITEIIADAVSSAASVISPSPGPTLDPVTVLEENAPTAIASVSSLSATIKDAVLPDKNSKPAALTEFMILLGDFIYADVPFSIGDTQAAYLKEYRRIYSSTDFRKVYERLPIFNIWDDHEIVNNAELGNSNEATPFVKNASDAYSIYQGQGNYETSRLDSNGQHPNYYEFAYGDVAFFVLDTRKYRSVVQVNTAEGEIPTILGEVQMADFRRWAGKVNSTAVFKFIVSSVPLTAMWGGWDGQVDTWIGAPEERRAFLDLLEYVPNVVIIPGDRHEFAAVEHLGKNPIHEFSISPLSQFYIPYVPTFRKENAPMREIRRAVNVTALDGTVELQEVIDSIPTEKILKYIPHGNYKFASFEVDTTDSQAPTVSIDLQIDGTTAWSHTIVGKPVRYGGGTALGSQIVETLGDGIKGVLDSLSKLGRMFG